MQAIMETLFDACYLSFAMITGLSILLKSKTSLMKKVGAMTFLLGFGDAFHLVPRCYALWTTGLKANRAILGMGKFITSITMTIFYLLLYFIYQEYYKQKDKKMDLVMYILTIARIVLCLFPQNDWLGQGNQFFGILRNIPFAIMGCIIIVLFYKQIKMNNDKIFKHMPLAITLSFGFYIPVVLWADVMPMLGMLMIPKTLAYVWVIVMCIKLRDHYEKVC